MLDSINHEEQKARTAAADRIRAAGDKRARAAQDAILARVEDRKMNEALSHLASTLGAAFISPDAISELALFTAQPAELLNRMIDVGRLGYDDNIAHVTLAMG